MLNSAEMAPFVSILSLYKSMFMESAPVDLSITVSELHIRVLKAFVPGSTH